MKILIALSFAIASLTFQVQAQTDTIEFNATIELKKVSFDDANARILNFLALKCETWMDVIRIGNTNVPDEVTYYLKMESLLQITPFINDGPVKRTYRFKLKQGSIEVFALYTNCAFDLAWREYLTFKISLLN